jgi:hypothetical protein
MQLIIKQHFHNTADVANEPGSVVLMKLYFSNGSINRSGIFYSHHNHNMLYMHIEMKFNEGFSYFGPLGHHFHDFTQCPHKVGPGARNVDGPMACTSIINEAVRGASK